MELQYDRVKVNFQTAQPVIITINFFLLTRGVGAAYPTYLKVDSVIVLLLSAIWQILRKTRFNCSPSLSLTFQVMCET